jgi:DNA-binding SARP family transcriptional activator
MPAENSPVRLAPVIELRLRGPFHVRGLDGADLTPKPHKARALLALLATAPDHRRARRWIEERLWSDRGPQQAAGSLRQALVDLRRAFGTAQNVLLADREWIALEPGAVSVNTTVAGEFLEGIAIRDAGFQRWLEAMRNRDAAEARTAQGIGEAVTFRANQAHPIVIRCGTATIPGSSSALVSEIIAARIAADISDQITVAVVAPLSGLAEGMVDLDVSCNVVEDNGICLALIRVVHVPTARVLFQKDCRFVGPASSLVGGADLIRVAYEAAERTVAKVPHVLGLGRSATKSAALTQLALHRMFSFDEAQLREADRLMQAAWEAEENPVHLAWRGLLQMVQAIELPQGMKPELHDLAERLTRQALERDTGNATLQALVAQTRAMLFGDARSAGEAARAAIDENPRNPYALQAMAVAKMLAGDGEAAYRTSLLGRAYAERSAFRHWWDAHHATVCVATGRIDEAIRAAEAAAFGAPSLRPAYRYLMSLHAQRGDLVRANEMRERLERLEPGFTLDRMLEDPEYPVRTLRQTGLLREVRKLM